MCSAGTLSDEIQQFWQGFDTCTDKTNKAVGTVSQTLVKLALLQQHKGKVPGSRRLITKSISILEAYKPDVKLEFGLFSYQWYFSSLGFSSCSLSKSECSSANLLCLTSQGG